MQAAAAPGFLPGHRLAPAAIGSRVRPAGELGDAPAGRIPGAGSRGLARREARGRAEGQPDPAAVTSVRDVPVMLTPREKMTLPDPPTEKGR